MFEQPPQNNIENGEENNKEEESLEPKKNVFEGIDEDWKEFQTLEKEKREQHINNMPSGPDQEVLANRFLAFELFESLLSKLGR